MNSEPSRWVEARAKGPAPEAMLRCALDLVIDRGVSVLGATPFDLEGQGEAAQSRCILAIQAKGKHSSHSSAGAAGADSDARGAFDAVGALLEGRVTFEEAPVAPAIGDVAPLLAGFPTEAIDHTADEAFSVRARDRADLCAAAAEALGALIVRPAAVRPSSVIAVSVPAPEPNWLDDDRLFAWLAEVLYQLDTARFALRRAVLFEDGEAGIRGALFGEPIDMDRHEVGGGIKAVTYHGMEIRPLSGGGLCAQVVIDV